MSLPPDPPIDVAAAAARIRGVAVRTPLVPSFALSDRVGAEVLLKLETVQPTGSFKVRGAASKILALSDVERSQGVVTASTGNHGRAVAYVARRLGIAATVCISPDVPPGKVRALRDLGARVEIVGASQSDALDRAHAIVESTGAAFVHPFDDPAVIAGQGTIGLEIAQDLPAVATVLVPLSGGGLMGGIATALAGAVPTAVPVAVSMERAPVMAMSLEAGRPVDVDEEETLADSLRGGIGLDNRYSFRLVSQLVKRVVLVGEETIWEGMRFLFEQHRVVAEGGAAVGVGALLAGAVDPLDGPVVVLVSGANAEPAHVAALIAGETAPTL
jgi:threonine dehydratase